MRQPDLLTNSSWQAFIILFSWFNLKDCIPVLIFFGIGVYVNYSVNTYTARYAIRRFFFYFIFGFYIYSIHLWAGGLEQQVFGKLLNLFEYYMASCVVIELSNFYYPENANLELKHPLLEMIFDKVKNLINMMFNK